MAEQKQINKTTTMITKFFTKKSCEKEPPGESDINNNTRKKQKTDETQNPSTSSDTIHSTSERKQLSGASLRPSQSHVAVTSTVKTVRRWMKELNTDIGYKVKEDSDCVYEVWCEVCKQNSGGLDHSGSTLVTGSNRVKKEAFQQHIKSTIHQRSVANRHAKNLEANKKPAPIEEGFKKADEKTLEKMDKLFLTAFYIVKKERPFSDFPDLLELQKLNGACVGETYRKEKAAKGFCSQIAGCLFDDLKKLLHEGDYFSVFCDGSTDRTEKEKESNPLVVVRAENEAAHHSPLWTQASVTL